MSFKTLLYCSTQMPSSTLKANRNLFSIPESHCSSVICISHTFYDFSYFCEFSPVFFTHVQVSILCRSGTFWDPLLLYDIMASEKPQHLILSHWYIGFNQLLWGHIFRALQSAIRMLDRLMYEEKGLVGMCLQVLTFRIGLSSSIKSILLYFWLLV